ncbi:hypothetical protein ACXPVS_23300 [Pseudomonas sp. Ma2-10]
MVARNERRYNFALNSLGAADIVLPGVHSDLGGGYLPKAMERILLSNPRKSAVDEKTPFTEANSYTIAQQDLRRLQDQLAQYNLPLEVRTWEVPYRSTDKDNRANIKYVYAAVSAKSAAICLWFTIESCANLPSQMACHLAKLTKANPVLRYPRNSSRSRKN